MASKRLQFEYKKLLKDPSMEGISVGPVDDCNIFKWRAVMVGPVGTPYEGGTFNAELEFPTDYPFKPPKMKFTTRIFHPNISTKGAVCVDILQKEWSPALTIAKVLLSISSLLASPNADDPLNSDAARLYQTDPWKYEETARNWTSRYA